MIVTRSEKMGLFKSKRERLADDTIRQTRQLGSSLANAAAVVVDDGTSRLKHLIDELESALKSNDLDAASLRENLRGKLSQVRSSVNDRSAALSDDFNAALGTADHYAHEKPWQVIGAVAGVALVIGFL